MAALADSCIDRPEALNFETNKNKGHDRDAQEGTVQNAAIRVAEAER